TLCQTLQTLGIPYRSEQALQDLASEPVARLVVDYLSVVFGEREPDAYERLIDFLLKESVDGEDADRLLTRWHARIQSDRDSLLLDGDDAAVAKTMAIAFLNELGRARVAALSPEYEKGP